MIPFHSNRTAGRRYFQIEPLEARLALDSTIVFSEIMYNPIEESESLEWVELHNQMAVNVDMSGWRISDGIEFSFPDGTVLEGGGYIVVAADVSALSATTGVTQIFGPYRGKLSNKGERLELRNHTDRLMNEVSYEDDSDWPMLADGSGASLAKLNPQAASHVAANWRASLQVGGTPGRTNFSDNRTIDERVIVPMVSNWRYEQSGTDLGTAWRAPGYDDSKWDQGNALLYVESSSLPGPKNTPLELGENTYYFRHQFEFDGEVDTAMLKLNHIIDDAAVFYLNGQEISRFHFDDGPINHQREADDSVTNASLDSTLIRDANLLRQGTNTLAVEVHQASSGSSDIVMGLELLLLRELSPTVSNNDLGINEVTSVSADSFWIELANWGTKEVVLDDFELASSEKGQSYVLTDQAIPAGGFLVIDEAQLGWQPDIDERIFLYSPDREHALDGVIVGSQAQARSPDHNLRWQTPRDETPGSDNAFDFQSDIVINEIMYNAKPTYARPARTVSSTYLDFDHTWRYEQSGDDLGTAWRAADYDDDDWPVGTGLFYVERADLPGPKSTELALGSPTHYFRTEFNITDASQTITMDHVVDDGAIFYLNGVEFDRFNMPADGAKHDTLAPTTVRNGMIEEGASLPKHLLVEGNNILAVEVHQQSIDSPDVAFGLRLNQEATLLPGIEYSESNEEWIELYNRGADTIDLAGWSISDAIDLEFDTTTLLGPDEYLVITNNEPRLRVLHPEIQIAGEFSGSLSNSGERIQLADKLGNISDEVHYYDDGRWPSFADGNGSSLELRDAFANNASAEAWTASDESDRSEWQRISYRGVAESIPHEPPINFHDFVMGLLAQGEVLIDNISVKDAAGKELIQNGSFENDRTGREPNKWRIQGTHEDSQVIVDPANPDNHVLQLIAEARMNYLGNHAETTLADGARVVDGAEYEISYDAKWIAGSPQLHTELYYEDAARTTILSQPISAGTPGAANSSLVNNLGPTYEQLSHSPVVPSSSDPVSIRVTPTDNHGIASLKLFYSIDGGGFRSLDMTSMPDGTYAAEIPPQANRRIVQFYVSGTNSLGATTVYPADGRDSRALYKVDNSFSRDTLRHDFQIIMTPRDASALHVNTNILDNDRVGSTVIYNGSEVFYNTGTRLRGSMFSRSRQNSTGYNVKFNADQLFRGIHESIGLDQGGEQEIIAKFTTLQTGNLGGTYDDVFDLQTPSGAGGGPTLVYLARHQDLFLNEQFENGSDGTLFKMEGIRVMTSTVDGNPESRKIYQPIGWVSAFDIEDMGDDKEKYRWPFLINNNRKKDDYSQLIEMAKALDAPTHDLQDEAMAILDVDNVTHTFALMSLLGIGDTYSQGNPHNLNIYVRPSDNKVLMFPWDWDFTFSQSTTAPLHGGKNIGRVLDQPHFEHFLLGHMQHMIETRFNRGYMSPWTSHFSEMLGGSYNQFLSRIQARGNYVKGQLPDDVPFAITRTIQRQTNVLVRGQGWVNVKELRLGPSTTPIDVEWTSATEWTATLPLEPGRNQFNLRAYDFGGQFIASAEFEATSETPRPLHDFLRISEINYHPAQPTSAEIEAGHFDDNAFEFVELVNTSSGNQAQTLDLSNVSLADGIEFTFPAGSKIAASERIVVVSDLAAFRSRYGNQPAVAGEFTSQLSNQGERFSLLDPQDVEISSIEYDDKDLWPEAADGLGATLVTTATTADGKDARSHNLWTASTEFGGSPGTAGLSPTGVIISEVRATRTDAIELFNSSDSTVDISRWFLSDDKDDLLDFQIPADTILGPNQYIVFDDSQFNFGLSSDGDDVWLVSQEQDGLRFIDEAHFGATRSGQSLAVTEQSRGRLTPVTRNGFGCGNAQPLVSDTMIQSIQYLPAEPIDDALALDPSLTSKDLQYVAIDGAVSEGWRLSGGVEYQFQDFIASGPLHWLVSFDPQSPANEAKVAAFMKHYEAQNIFPFLVGGYKGSLKTSGEQILLQRPTENGSFETIDEVIYDTGRTWPTARRGEPIVRRGIYFGNHGHNWVHRSDASPGLDQQGDFNGDNQVDVKDLDLLIDAVNRGSQRGEFVTSGTFPVPTREEIEYFIEELGTAYGDTNLDGVVDDLDTRVPGDTCGGWEAGDFNGDNVVDDVDLKLAGQFEFTYDFALFLQISANFGKTDPPEGQGDIDGDQEVGFKDFLILSARFGT